MHVYIYIYRERERERERERYCLSIVLYSSIFNIHSKILSIGRGWDYSWGGGALGLFPHREVEVYSRARFNPMR